MFHKVVLCILILSCFSLFSCSGSGENDEKRDGMEEQMEKEQEQSLADVEQKETMLKEEAEAQGTAVPAGICDRTIQVQKALLAKAEKENCEQIRDQDLQAIVKLDLSNKNITQLKANDFSGLTSLQRLDLYNNKLASLPEGIFSGLTSLQWLFLYNNELASLPEGIFSGLTSLQMLSLYNNELASLPEGIFSGLTSLQWLFLHNNELASLPVGLFSGLTSLKRLYLDASFQQEEDRIINEVGRDINIIFEGGGWWPF